MKIILLLFISLKCTAQTVEVDTSSLSTEFLCQRNDSNYIEMLIDHSDTSLVIAGDTVSQIKEVFKYLGKEMQENKKIRKLLNEAAELLYKKYYGVEAILPEKKRS